MNYYDALVLGGGISGLVTAYKLNKAGNNVLLVEKNLNCGGSIETFIVDGNIYEYGAHSIILVSSTINSLIEELNIEDSVLIAGENSYKKFILKDNSLYYVFLHPDSILNSPIFSFRTKLKFFLEKFLPRSKDDYGITVESYIKKRLGNEFLRYFMEPVASEVYAGDVSRLSIKAAYPKIFALEKEYGSLVTGMKESLKKINSGELKPSGSGKLISFKDGMSFLTKTLVRKLDGKIQNLSEVIEISKTQNGYSVTVNNAGETKVFYAKSVISTIQAYKLAEVNSFFPADLIKTLNAVNYASIVSVNLSFKKNDVRRLLEGYGILTTASEKKPFRTVIYSSELFPDKYNPGTTVFTIYSGGINNPEILDLDDEEIFESFISELKNIMDIKADPLLKGIRKMKRALPQYETGYGEMDKSIVNFETLNPGFYIAGNFRGGISTGDSIKNATESAIKIDKYLKDLTFNESN